MLDGKLKKSIKRKILYNNFINGCQRHTRCIFGEKNFRNDNFMKQLPNLHFTQDIIKNEINNKEDFLLLRFGLYEYILCYQFLEKQCDIRKYYSDFIKYHISFDAGIFDNNDESLDEYAIFVLSNLKNVDVMAYWRDMPRIEIFNNFYSKDLKHINVDFLYPFPFLHKDELPDWQTLLQGNKVLIVSSFADTISRQYKKRKAIWKDFDYILPEMELMTYQSIVTNGGNKDDRFVGWKSAVDYMVNDIEKMNCDIILVSCGGYGMPLSIELNDLGKKVIQWGGCFQLWFGILGGRWLDNPGVKEFINLDWTFPSVQETPPLYRNVNNASYWNPHLK